MRTLQTDANPGVATWIDGVQIEGTLATARPVGTLVRNTLDGEIYASTDAVVPTYTQVTNSGGVSFTGIVLATTTGTITNYGTIAAAMGAAAAGDEILLYPNTYAESIDFTGKTSVRVVGIGAPQSVIISGPDAASVRVTASSGCSIRNLTIRAPSAGANPAVDVSPILINQLFSTTFITFIGQGGTGPFYGGAHAGTVTSFSCSHNGGAASAFIDTSGGSGTYGIDRVVLGFGMLTDVFKVDGTATVIGQVVTMNAGYTCTDIFEVGGTAKLALQVLTRDDAALNVNGLHITADGVNINLDLVHLTSSTYDVLADAGLTGAGSSVSMNACEFSLERVNAPSNWLTGLSRGLALFLDPGVNNDEAYRVMTELSVGIPQRPSESSFGEGDSSVNGMHVLSDNGAGVFVDNTAAASSRTGSTFSLFQGTAVGNAAYFGSDSTDARMFPNIKIDGGGTAINLGAGALTWEFWDGATWTAFRIMVTDAEAPYLQKGSAAFAITNTNDHIRFDSPTLTAAWQTTAVNGITGYWVRCRISAGPITTVPVLERVKLGTNRTEINSDGFVEFFGSAEPERSFQQVSLAQAVGLVGSAPSSVNISYSATVVLNYARNGFNNGAVDGFGLSFTLPANLDTSRMLQLHVHWSPSVATAGDVEFELYAVRAQFGDVLDGTLPEVRTTKIEVVGAGQQDVFFDTRIDLDLSAYDDEDQVTLAVLRDATGGNPDDTLAGNVEISSIELYGTLWR